MAQTVATVITARKKTDVMPEKVAQPYTKDVISGVYLITNTGLEESMGKNGDELKQAIENNKEYSPLDFRFFDDDNHRWAYWAVMDVDGKIRPHTFPSLGQYSLTSPQLYTKAVTYPRILAHAVGLLKEKPATLWDKMMKPTTIILAIVAVVFVMGLMLMALQG
jgi:hypothetical protein